MRVMPDCPQKIPSLKKKWCKVLAEFEPVCHRCRPQSQLGMHLTEQPLPRSSAYAAAAAAYLSCPAASEPAQCCWPSFSVPCRATVSDTHILAPFTWNDCLQDLTRSCSRELY